MKKGVRPLAASLALVASGVLSVLSSRWTPEPGVHFRYSISRGRDRVTLRKDFGDVTGTLRINLGKAIVKHVVANDVELRAEPEGGGWWRISSPSTKPGPRRFTWYGDDTIGIDGSNLDVLGWVLSRDSGPIDSSQKERQRVVVNRVYNVLIVLSMVAGIILLWLPEKEGRGQLEEKTFKPADAVVMMIERISAGTPEETIRLRLIMLNALETGTVEVAEEDRELFMHGLGELVKRLSHFEKNFRELREDLEWQRNL